MGVKMKVSKKALGCWANRWGDFDKHEECLNGKSEIDGKPNHITDFGRGYNQAIRDLFEKIGGSEILDEVMIKKKQRKVGVKRT